MGKICLLLMHGGLSSDPKLPRKEPSMAVCVPITQALVGGRQRQEDL